jgi:Na+/H+-translocating membrane pyrophosphatase
MRICTQVLIAISPLDVVYDIGLLTIGKDLLTGYQLSNFEKGAILAGLVVGLFTAGIGDDLLQAGARLSRYGDDVGDVAGLGRVFGTYSFVRSKSSERIGADFFCRVG